MSTPLCVGNADLFESVDPGHHLSAARICARCDFIDECRTIRDDRSINGSLLQHQGTWAGELWLKGKRAEIRRCHCGVLLTRINWGGEARTECADCHNMKETP